MSDAFDDLIDAIESNDLEGATSAIRAGADLSSRTRFGGYSPLHYAAVEDRMRIFQSLLTTGAPLDVPRIESYDPGKILGTPLVELSARTDRLAYALLLVEAGANVHARDFYGRTPLHFACGADERRALVVALLKRGADPRAADEDGSTPLHQSESAFCTDALLAAGATPDATGWNEETPLMVRARRGGLSCVRLLLSAGADKSVVDGGGRTAQQLAANGGHAEIARLLASSESAAGDVGATHIDEFVDELLHYLRKSSLTAPNAAQVEIALHASGQLRGVWSEFDELDLTRPWPMHSLIDLPMNGHCVAFELLRRQPEVAQALALGDDCELSVRIEPFSYNHTSIRRLRHALGAHSSTTPAYARAEGETALKSELDAIDDDGYELDSLEKTLAASVRASIETATADAGALEQVRLLIPMHEALLPTSVDCVVNGRAKQSSLELGDVLVPFHLDDADMTGMRMHDYCRTQNLDPEDHGWGYDTLPSQLVLRSLYAALELAIDGQGVARSVWRVDEELDRPSNKQLRRAMRELDASAKAALAKLMFATPSAQRELLHLLEDDA